MHYRITMQYIMKMPFVEQVKQDCNDWEIHHYSFQVYLQEVNREYAISRVLA